MSHQALYSTLSSKILSANNVLSTATAVNVLYPESKTLAQLEATFAYYSNQDILQTATASQVVESASAAMAQASATIEVIHQSSNLYGGLTPSYGGNLALAVIFGIFFLLHTLSGIWFKQWWFGVAFFCGCGLEMAGYIGRTLSNGDYTVLDWFLLQIICLTIAPAFIMGGIYYILAKFIMIYGTKFAIMKPMWYSYIFIVCDVISLVIQAAGGGLAATSLTANESTESGTHVMVAGLAFQVFSMSIYIFLYLHFFHKIRFLHPSQHKQLDDQFNPDYKHIRDEKMFKIFPYVVFIGVLFVYVRCIYRVVELAEGWTGFLIVHEVYFMILDALMMALTCLILLIFYPGYILHGRTEKIPVKGMKSYKPEENLGEEGQHPEQLERKQQQLQDQNANNNGFQPDLEKINQFNDDGTSDRS